MIMKPAMLFSLLRDQKEKIGFIQKNALAIEPTTLLGLILLSIGSYLLGSVCWAIIIGKIKMRKDIRNFGDGNPGAYNLGKALGIKLGLLVMFLDSLKGFIPAIIATTVDFKEYRGWALGLAGTMSILGHCYPLFFRFKGGNGYSTIFGFMIVFQPFMILEWGVLVFVLTLLFKYIRPIQMISIVVTGTSGFIIKWPRYWWNFAPQLTTELAMFAIPITVLFVAAIQLPKFIPYFIGIFKGTEEKIYFFRFQHRKKEQLLNEREEEVEKDREKELESAVVKTQH